MHFVTYNIHNILTDGAKAYTYSTRNQQKTYSDEDTSASYTYYYDGLRKSKTVGTNTTYFIWHNGNMVYEFTPTNSNSYTYGHRLISSDDAKYVLNAHGDVVVLLKDVEYEDLWHEGEDGNNLYVTYTVTEVVKRYDYDAFGNELNIDTTDTNPFRYCAEYFDTETGTIYLRARYYSPVTGRFTQLDPIKDGLNWYAYCVNNPVMFVDPSGTYYIRKLKNGNYKLEPETVWTTLSYTFFTPITHLYFRDIKSVVAGTSYVSDESMFYDAGGYAAKTGDKIIKGTTDVISNYGTAKGFFERMDIVYSEGVNFKIFEYCGYSQESASAEYLDNIMALTTYYANINSEYFIDKCYNNMTMFELHCNIKNNKNPSKLIDKYVSGYESILLQRKRDGIPTGGMIRDPNIEGDKFRRALSAYSDTLSQVKEHFKTIKSIG